MMLCCGENYMCTVEKCKKIWYYVNLLHIKKIVYVLTPKIISKILK